MRRGRRKQRHLSVRGGNGFRRDDVRGEFPESRGTAAFAKAHNAFVGGADVGFNAGVVDFFECLARIAGEREQAEFAFEQADGGELEAPEINFWIDERDAVGVDAIVTAELAHHTNFRFFVVFRPAEDELLFGREFVG